MHRSNKGFGLLCCLTLITLIVISPLSAQEETPAVETTIIEEVPTEAPPAEVPTDIPTEVPTEMPTEVVTEVPTEVPIDVPTDIPPVEPTEEATEVPTAEATEEIILAAPVFNLAQTSYETTAGLSLVIDLSVSDDGGLVRVVEDASATLGGVSVSAASEASESDAGYDTAVSVTYLAPADYAGADSFSLTAVDMTGQSASVVISVNVAAVEATEEALLEMPEDTVQAAMIYTVNSTADDSDFNTADGLCDVDNVTAGSQCTLRAAIEQANVNVGTDTIKFALASPYVIAPASDLPQIIQPVNITGTLGKVILDGTNADTNGLFVDDPADGSSIKGLVIINFPSAGIWLRNSTNITIQGNYIGVEANGTIPAGNGFVGINLERATNTIIGGSSAAERNIISGNWIGVYLELGSNNNTISGNYIGTDKTGKIAIPNSHEGIYLTDASSNIIGGDVAGERNIISGNIGDSVAVIGDSANNVVSGNYIGVDATGKADLGNGGAGVSIGSFAGGNTVGGDSVGERNIISGNEADGVNIASDGQVVSGNYIGTDLTGSKGIPNGLNGLAVSGAGNLIGGDVAAEGNLISGNQGDGLNIGGSINTVSGNTIGLVAAGNKALGNGGAGVWIGSFAGGNTVGGDSAGERNVISNNLGFAGILIEGNGNIVSGNYIGTDKTGKKGLGNSIGVIIWGYDNLIGGDVAAEANIIAFNFNMGVDVSDSAGNTINYNSFFNNGDRGIDLSLGIADGNNSLAAPAITAVTTTQVDGTFPATVDEDYRVEIFSNVACDSSGFGEGQTFLGSVVLTADAASETFSLASITPALKAGVYITATLTHIDTGDTSEFSECLVLAATAPKAKPSLTLPANNSIFYDGGSVFFTWKSTSLANSYRLELATDKNFSNMIFFEDIPVAATQFFFVAYTELGDVLPDGDYYWRVRGENSFGNGPYSSPFKFTVNSNSAPTLLKPANADTSPNGSYTFDNTPTFSWKALPGAKGYNIFWFQGLPMDCSDVHIFGEGHYTTKTSYTPLSGNELSEGFIFWCVQAFDSQNNVSAVSQVFNFDLTLMKSPLNYAVTTDTTPTFVWNKAPGTGVTYRLLVDDDQFFGSPEIDQPGLTRTSFTPLAADALDASNGYFWRVEVSGGSWTVNTPKAWTFFIAPAKLVAPVLVDPTNGATNLDPEALVLDWNPVAAIGGVNIQYEIWVSTSAAFTNRQGFLVVGDDFVDVSFALNPSTRYYWKVRAQYSGTDAGTGFGPWSQTRNFMTGT